MLKKPTYSLRNDNFVSKGLQTASTKIGQISFSMQSDAKSDCQLRHASLSVRMEQFASHWAVFLNQISD